MAPPSSLKFLAAGLAAVLACLSATCAADFHPITSVTTSTSNDLWPVSNLIQGPGTGFAATEPHDRLGSGATSLWVTESPAGDYYTVRPAPVLVIDLGADRQLSEISTWGYFDSNTNGAKDISLRFATAAEGSNGLGSSISYNPGFEAAFSPTVRDSHPFSQTVTARYVEVTITDNWLGFQGGTPGGDRVGLGEIAFEDSVPPIDPQIDITDTLGLNIDGSVQNFDIPVGNLGATQTLNITGTSFTGSNAGAFSVIGSPASISPGGSSTIQISFNPTGLTGNISASLLVTSTDPGTPTATVTLSGFLHDPRLEVAGVLSFGTIAPGSGAQAGSLTVSNGGGGQNLVISNTNITGGDAGHFTVTSTPASIAPFGSDAIGVSFDPLGMEGSFDAQLTITSNDSVNTTTVVNLLAVVSDVDPNSGVRINEFMASNGTTLDDGDGFSSDWIELFNAGPRAADISGWHLTDSLGNLTKWEFPPGTILNENTFLIIFASGQNTNDYVDGGGFLHTNFKLTTGGEYLALVEANGTTVVSEFSPIYPAQFNDVAYGTFASGGSTEDLIAGSDADVLVPDDGSLALTWTLPAFTPSGWTSGPGNSVGYERASSNAYDPFFTIDVESEFYNQDKSVYVRIPFNLGDASLVQALTLRVRYDDGFVAHLNGQEIATRNAPATPVWNSNATSSHSDSLAVVFEDINVSAFLGSLQNGTNILALHGLNSSNGSSDFLLATELVSTMAGEGPASIGYLQTATPGLPNTGGSANPGPEITAAGHTPSQPTESESIVVTATVAPRLAAVSSVDLHYRVVYGSTTTISMTDTGGGVYTATIPASAYGAEDMVRWYLTATDTSANSSRAPAFLDQTGKGQSPEYFGSVTRDPAVSSDAPLFQWFTQSESASHTRSGARASVYFLGRFYDNIFVRQRGGATNGSVSQKFDFNKGDGLYIDESMPSVGEINMNGRGSDSTYVRQPLAFEAYETAGNAACQSALWQMRVNGGNDRVGVFIEQVDEDFLQRNGYDPDGELYKLVQHSNLNPVFFDTVTGIEKKTGDQSDLTSIQGFVAGLNQGTSLARRRYIIDNLDLPQVVNYLAVRSITQDADDVRKNFYIYQDARGDQRWRMFPWDKDWTFGITGDGGTWLPHPFFGDEEHSKQNADQWNVLYDVVFEETTSQRIYLRRLRTVMDEVLQPSSTPSSQRYFENRADEIIDPASPPLSSNVSSIDNYLNSRRNVLNNNYPSLIPPSQSANPDIEITDAEYNPSSGNQDHEYIVLTNNESTEIDISGWCLSGGVDFVFRPGTVIERNSVLYVSPDTLAFRQRPTSPTGNEERLAVGPYSGHLSNFGETLTLKDKADTVVSTYMTPVDPSDAQLYLVVSEIMYHPSDPTPDAEFIELMNVSSSVTLDIGGVSFTAGIDYTFPPGTMLAPGARIVVNFADFENASRLNNGSDHLKLEDATGSTISDFSYNDNPPWPTAPDGNGPSLVLIDPASSPDPSLPENWRQSSTDGGNPGSSDAVPYGGGDLLAYAVEGQPSIALGGSGNALFSFDLIIAAEDVIVSPEWSTDLESWTSTGLTLFSESSNGTGIASFTWSVPPGDSAFVRLRVEERP